MMTEEQKQALINDLQSEKLVLEKWRDDWNARDKVNYQAIDIALTALTQPASPALKLPDGWVAVPREATSEMIESGWTYSVLEKNATAKGTWACMVAAAPAVPHTAPIEPICSTGGEQWTRINIANDALIMLDRIDTIDSDDDERVIEIKRIIRILAESKEEE